MKTTEEAILHAKTELYRHDISDNEVIHAVYDELIEERLREVDPVFMEQFPYPEGVSRWCA